LYPYRRVPFKIYLNIELFKRSIQFQKFILQKLLTLIHVLCKDGKEISQSSDIDDLKRRITKAVAAVTCDMLR
jgi:hypothetical protein